MKDLVERHNVDVEFLPGQSSALFVHMFQNIKSSEQNPLAMQLLWRLLQKGDRRPTSPARLEIHAYIYAVLQYRNMINTARNVVDTK